MSRRESAQKPYDTGVLGVGAWQNVSAASTANGAARATAAKRSPGLTITNQE